MLIQQTEDHARREEADPYHGLIPSESTPTPFSWNKIDDEGSFGTLSEAEEEAIDGEQCPYVPGCRRQSESEVDRRVEYPSTHDSIMASQSIAQFAAGYRAGDFDER